MKATQFVPVVAVAMLCATAFAAPDTQPAGEKLAPGKTPGTFHLVYRGTVRFTMAPQYPTVVSLDSNFIGTKAEITVKDGNPFTVEADLPPGTYWIAAQPIGKARSSYWEIKRVRFFIDKSGNVSPELVLAKELLLIHKVTGLSPADDQTAGEDEPVLKWDPVVGAKWYEGGFQAGNVSGPIQTADAHFKLPKLPAGEYCEWFVHADGNQWRELAYGSAVFYPHGTPPPQQPRPARGFVGILMDSASATRQTGTTQPAGAPVAKSKAVSIRVAGVVDDSPAAKAGLRPGDGIVAVNGKPLTPLKDNPGRGDADDFADQIRSATPGTVLTLTVRRGSDERRIPVTVGPPPDRQALARLTGRPGVAAVHPAYALGIVPHGFFVNRDPKKSRQIDGGRGMLWGPGDAVLPCIAVDEIAPNSPAIEAGLRPGDMIIALDGKPVSGERNGGFTLGDANAFTDQIRAMQPGTVVTLTVRRGAGEVKIPVTVGP